jgi:hypothetical protein
VGLANLGSESETCVGSRVRLVGVFLSIEKNFYRLPFTPPPLWFAVSVLQTVNVLFSRLPTKRSQKATRWEVLNIELVVSTPLRWSGVPITFSRADHWTSFSEPGHFSLVLKPVAAGSRLHKVLIDGGSGLNVLFTKTLKKMKLYITHMLTKSTSPCTASSP